jgi:O-antigen ligase
LAINAIILLNRFEFVTAKIFGEGSDSLKSQLHHMKRGDGRDQSPSTAALDLTPGFSVRTVHAAPAIGYVPKTVYYAFLLFVFSIPFEDVDLPYLTSETFSLANLFGLVFFALYLFHLVLQVLFFSRSVPEVPVAMRWFIGYFVVYALGGWLLDHEPGRAYFLRLVSLVQTFGFFWCASDLLKDESLRKSCLLAFALACVILALGTLLHLPGFVPVIDDRTRALGMNPNAGASLVVLAALILLAFSLNESQWSRKRRWLLVTLTLPLFALLVSTASRSGAGAFVIGISMFFFAKGGLKRKIVAGLLAVVAAAAVISLIASHEATAQRWARFFEEGDSIRADLYRTALEMIGERPIVGWGRTVGFEELGSRIGLGGRIDAHNFLLYLLLEVGSVGAAPFLVGLGLCLWAAWKARGGTLGILPLTLLVCSLAGMMTHTGLRDKTFWLFLALALAAAVTVKRQIIIRFTASHEEIAQHKQAVRSGAVRRRRR